MKRYKSLIEAHSMVGDAFDSEGLDIKKAKKETYDNVDIYDWGKRITVVEENIINAIMKDPNVKKVQVNKLEGKIKIVYKKRIK